MQSFKIKCSAVCKFQFSVNLYYFPKLSEQATVQRIHIDGLARTKDDIVIEQVKDLFKAGTFKEVIEKSSNAKLRLEKLGIFTGVGVFIDTSKGKKIPQN